MLMKEKTTNASMCSNVEAAKLCGGVMKGLARGCCQSTLWATRRAAVDACELPQLQVPPSSAACLQEEEGTIAPRLVLPKKWWLWRG